MFSWFKFAILMNVANVAVALTFPFGHHPSRAAVAPQGTQGKDQHASASLGTPFSPSSTEIDPDLLDALLFELGSESPHHYNTLRGGTEQHQDWQSFHSGPNSPTNWHVPDNIASFPESNQPDHSSVQPVEQQAGSSRTVEGIAAVHEPDMPIEQASKRRMLFQRVAKALHDFSPNRQADPAALKNIINSRRPDPLPPAAVENVQPLTHGFVDSSGSPPQLDGQRDIASVHNLAKSSQHAQLPVRGSGGERAWSPVIHLIDSSQDTQGSSHRQASDSGSIIAISSDDSKSEDDDAVSAGHVSQIRTGSKRKSRAYWSRVEPQELKNLVENKPTLNREKGASRFSFHLYEAKAIRDTIDSAFGNTIRWVDMGSIEPRTLSGFNKAAREKSRILPLPHLPEIKLGQGMGTIRKIRMTTHGGMRGRVEWPRNHELAQGQTFYSFIGVPEDAEPAGPAVIYRYGIGYIDPVNFHLVDQRFKVLKKEVAEQASQAAKHRSNVVEATRQAIRLPG